MINDGDVSSGYFYIADGFEKDILQFCLAANDQAHERYCFFVDRDYRTVAKTSSWSVQELWAQTAWRIVEDNCGSGEAFAKSFRQSPKKPYAFVIEMLCVAFHSIAHRSRNSVWVVKINAPPGAAAPKSLTTSDLGDDREDSHAASDSGLEIGDEDGDECSSGTFNDSAYEECTESEDERLEKQRVEEEEPSIELGAAILVRLCDASTQPLQMIDETGEAITGYYTRSKVVTN